MKLIAEKGDFQIYFETNNQEYIVYYKNKILIRNKFKYSDVKSYVE